MSIARFEDVIAWKLARELAGRLYKILAFTRDYSFKDQIIRAAVSIMNNIAEGFGRSGNKELIRYLKIAKGSCLEVRSMLYLGLDNGYFNETDFRELFGLTVRIEQLMVNFIKSIQTH